MRQAIFHGVGIFELLGEEVPLFRSRLQVERVREEVVGRRILVHAADKVRDGVEEMLVFHHGRVEDDAVAQHRLRPPQVVGHAFQHLERHVSGCSVALCQQVGVSDGE